MVGNIFGSDSVVCNIRAAGLGAREGVAVIFGTMGIWGGGKLLSARPPLAPPQWVRRAKMLLCWSRVSSAGWIDGCSWV